MGRFTYIPQIRIIELDPNSLKKKDINPKDLIWRSTKRINFSGLVLKSSGRQWI